MKTARMIFVLFFLLVPSEARGFSDLVRWGKEPPECFCKIGENIYLLITGDKYREYEWREEEQALVAIHHRRRLEVKFKPDGGVWFAWEMSRYRLEMKRLEFNHDHSAFHCRILLTKKGGDGQYEKKPFEIDGKIERGGAWEECFNDKMGTETGDKWERWIFDKRFIFSRIKATFYYRNGCLVAIDY